MLEKKEHRRINYLSTKINQEAQDHVLNNLFNRFYDTRMLFHNFQHTADIVTTALDLVETGGGDANTKEVVELSAWFLNTGFLADYNEPYAQSIRYADEFLTAKQFDKNKKERVLKCLRNIKDNVIPTTDEQKYVMDATRAQDVGESHIQRRSLLRLEWELYVNRPVTDVEWEQMQLNHLLQTKFYSKPAKKQYEGQIAKNIYAQKSRLEKRKNRAVVIEPETEPSRYKNLNDIPTSRATQTYFRANFRNHINISAIADNKANIMISVNAIMISVVISMLSYRNIPETNPMVLLPVVIFLVTGMASLIFAVLSIRPKVTNLSEKSKEEVKKNLVFFGNFVNLSLPDFEDAMDEMFRDEELIYGNMVRDLYYLGKVLDKKYRYLTTSYNIFMVGFVATVLTFLIAILTA